ncbi:hypothetical protein CK203_029746 [Vitis vinifera]|uniref:Uncharacterized protein n=1 Tax=Vitis vinifera TaxID=29760 RepID=A0A438IIJ0_VITVI|nr:hypothetical protein CK203_029746 [Vitis vinifera]
MKLIVDKGTVKASQMLSLKNIESMMVDINDIEEFKRVFLIFTCATLLAPTSRLEDSHSLWRKDSVWIKGCLMFLQIFYFSISNFPTMYVELTTPRIAAWNNFLVKQRIKLELEMLGGFGKFELVSTLVKQDQIERNEAPTVDDPDETEDFDVICARMEATWRQIIDAQSHVNILIASYNRDMNMLRTRFTSSHYRTDEDEGVSKKPNIEEGVLFANEDHLHPRPYNMLVLVQSCMDNYADVATKPQKK